LSDFEDAYNHLEEDAKDVKREIQLVADSLRLGGAILGKEMIWDDKTNSWISFAFFLAFLGGVLENEGLQVEHHLRGYQSKGRDNF
jgi:hypothetical protein